EAGNISRELSSELGSNIEIYDVDGKDLSNLSNAQAIINDDVQLNAVKGLISYKINYMDNRVVVDLSYPVLKDNITIGIVRFYKDYTEIFSYNKRFKEIINAFAVMIFIAIFIVSLVLSRHITKPVRKLINSTERISKGDFDSKIDIDSEDEIGELAGRFKIMVQRIRGQIRIIERDRDDLKEAQMHSKVFFDNVTHELKTPLTTILGYAQIIKENGFSDKNFFDKGIFCIINESKRMNKMVVQVLEISKFNSSGSKYQFKRVNFSELIVKTCDEMGIKARKYGINIRCLIQDGLAIYGDEDKLKEIIINLIDNSIKYGNVNSDVECKAYHEGNHIFVKIKDKGKGIPKECIDNLFEPFYRISKRFSREKGSVGLGLTIVKKIVERHNGTVNIKSVENIGTEVTLDFKGENND
ncbi:MAG TPA: sensor histidine kinase, partial [Clostridiaceae bacterium]|nr:sensor histidine kinase [Clostridiaceae bacterium]